MLSPGNEEDDINDVFNPTQNTLETQVLGASSILGLANPPESQEQNSQTSEPHLRLMPARQNILKNACKRRRMSTTGSKAELAARLYGAGFKTMDAVQQLATEFNRTGVDPLASVHGRTKTPNWSKNETARLCHVIQDPRHSTELARLYNKPANRALMDMPRRDPWAFEFASLFNDEEFRPVRPNEHDGVTADVLLSFDPNIHPHVRQGSVLKSKWNKIRSKYSIARDRFTRSGQGDADVFTDFTDGDPSLAYLHCVFYNSPALHYVIRTIPIDARVEEGIPGADSTRSNDTMTGKKRKALSPSDLSSSIGELAKSLAAPVQWSNTDTVEPSVEDKAKINELDMSNRMAGTVEKLMNLEKQLLSRIKDAEEEGDSGFAGILRGRLADVRVRIDRAFLL